MPNLRISTFLLILFLAFAAIAAPVPLTGTLTATPYAAIGHLTTPLLTLTVSPYLSAMVTFSWTTPPGTTFARPADFAASGCTGPADGTAGTITCSEWISDATYFVLPVNITPSVTPGTTLNYVVTVSSTTTSPLTITPSVSQTAALLPELAISSTRPTSIVAGGPVDYDVTVHNAGPGTAADSFVFGVSAFESNMVRITSVSAPCAFAGMSGHVNCALPPLAAGSSITMHVSEITSPRVGDYGWSASTVAVGESGNSLVAYIDQYALVTHACDVSVTSSAPAQVTTGDDFTYTITATAAGPSSGLNVALAYTTPPGTTFMSASTSGNVGWCTGPATGTAGAVTCYFDRIEPASAFTIAKPGIATITLHAASAGTVTHQVNLTAADDSSAGNNTSSAVTQIVDGTSADLSVTLTADASASAAGDVAGSISIRNDGASAALNVITRLSALGDVSQMPAGCTAGGGSSITCTIASFAPGATQTYPFHLALPIAGTHTLIATVTSDTRDFNTANNTNVKTTFVPQTVDLAVTSAGVTAVSAGTVFPWSISVTNNGSSTPSGVSVFITLPDGVTVDPSPGCTNGSSGALCFNAGIAPHATASFTMNVHAPQAAGSYTLTFNALATVSDINPADNSGQFTFNVLSQRLDLSLDPKNLALIPAQVFPFTITVRNGGSLPAPVVEITDTLPAGLTALSAIPSAGSCVAGQAIDCHVGTLQPGATVTVAVTAVAPLSGAATNTVTATSDTQTLEAAQTITILPTSRHHAVRH